MKPQIPVILICCLALSGCVTKSKSTNIWPAWQDVKGKTNSEISTYLYDEGDRMFVQIYTAKKLLEERRSLLTAKSTKEAQLEVERIDGHIKALDEQAEREAKRRFDHAFATATEKRN